MSSAMRMPNCVGRRARRARDGRPITLTNTANKTQTFSMAATPFKGPAGDTGVTVAITPMSASLNPNQSATITVGLDVGDKFDAGSAYSPR